MSPPFLKRKTKSPEKLQVYYFFWTHQKAEVTGQSTSLESTRGMSLAQLGAGAAHRTHVE